MHVTLYKPGKTPIPPSLYGGTERVIYWLGKALIELGHQVTLIANQQSHIPGAKLRTLSSDERDPGAWLELVPASSDIVHAHEMFQAKIHKPVLFTCHGNGQPGERFHPNTVFVSKRHAANHGSVRFVHNGIDPDDYLFSSQRDDYAIFLAKARWKVKNFQGAVSVARQAGIELRVLGSRNWPLNLQRWLPQIRGVRYFGMLGGHEKAEMISRARCLIFPVRWEEPFGLALTEAMISGAYVVGTPYGSLPEIVTTTTGVLSSDASTLTAAVQTPHRYPPETCRDHVLRSGFTHLDMAKKYLQYYEQVLAQGTLLQPGEQAPATRPDFLANHLLPWSN